MEYYALSWYFSFQCLAGNCTSTCCSGWKIKVAKEDFDRFCSLEDQNLKDDILHNLEKQGELYFFKNRQDGRCRMLDEDGLCRIQRNSDEKTLCNTCRKYPRLVNQKEDILYISMAASCPVISRKIITEEITFYQYSSQRRKEITFSEIPFCQEILTYFQEEKSLATLLLEQQTNQEVLVYTFQKMAGMIAENLLNENSQTSKFVIHILACYEEEISGNIVKQFLEDSGAQWIKLLENYVEYRCFSRCLEYIEETKEDAYQQICGELLFFRTILFAKYTVVEKLELSDWYEILQIMYRICAHGERIAEKFHHLFCDFFHDNVLWFYVLL